MLIRWDCLNNSIAATCLAAAALLPTGAFAVSVEVAKKCNLLVRKNSHRARQVIRPPAASRDRFDTERNTSTNVLPMAAA